MAESTTWRVKDAAGVVHEAPPIIKREISGKPFYTCEGRGNWQDTEIAAVRWWMIPIDAREIAAPGELFASEQVAAETERCIALLDARMRQMESCGSHGGLGWELARLARRMREGAPK